MCRLLFRSARGGGWMDVAIRFELGSLFIWLLMFMVGLSTFPRTDKVGIIGNVRVSAFLVRRITGHHAHGVGLRVLWNTGIHSLFLHLDYG